MTKKDIPQKYINIVQDMYREVKMNVMTCGGAERIFQSQLTFIKPSPKPLSFRSGPR